MTINRQDAIDAIYEHEFSNWCDKDEVSTILYDLPSADKWIPCSERLPGKYKRVLTTSKKGVVRENFINAGGWSYDTYSVVAWMPLPEPWKGADDEAD